MSPLRSATHDRHARERPAYENIGASAHRNDHAAPIPVLEAPPGSRSRSLARRFGDRPPLLVFFLDDARRLRRPGRTRDRPVLVWFPGGAFTTGSASQPVYNGSRFCVEQDVVLVTCNYRLGALGFLDVRAVGGSTNCGLRDAIATLEWVR